MTHARRRRPSSGTARGVRPAPIFCWNGRRRMRASWMRSTRIAVDALADAGQRDRQRVHREAGIDAGAEHGDLRLAAPARRSSCASRLVANRGYASSSVVETIGSFSFRIASIWPATFERRARAEHDDVGLGGLDRLRRSRPTPSPCSGRPTPATSPRSLPILAGSMSTAPTILKPLRDATCRTTATPMGPRPKCRTRIGPFCVAIPMTPDSEMRLKLYLRGSAGPSGSGVACAARPRTRHHARSGRSAGTGIWMLRRRGRHGASLRTRSGLYHSASLSENTFASR